MLVVLIVRRTFRHTLPLSSWPQYKPADGTGAIGPEPQLRLWLSTIHTLEVSTTCEASKCDINNHFI